MDRKQKGLQGVSDNQIQTATGRTKLERSLTWLCKYMRCIFNLHFYSWQTFLSPLRNRSSLREPICSSEIVFASQVRSAIDILFNSCFYTDQHSAAECSRCRSEERYLLTGCKKVCQFVLFNDVVLVLHTGQTDGHKFSWKVELHPPARRQEVTIYRLLSPHWKFHKLLFSSLWAVSIATVFCFPPWQEERDRSSVRRGRGRGVRSGHSRGTRSRESKEQNVDGCRDKTQEACRALSGFSCSGISAQPNTALHKADEVWLTVTFS